MKRLGTILVSVLMLATAMLGQVPSNTAQLAAVGSAGSITSSSLTATVAPGPVYCRGTLASLAPTSIVFPANSTWYLYVDCTADQIGISAFPPPVTNATPNLALIVAGATTLAVTDLRSSLYFGTTANTGNTAYLTGSAYTNATTTFSNVTGLAFPIAASQNYHMVCRITWQGSAGTTGPKYQFTGPGSPTAVAVGLNSPITAATAANASAVAFSSPVANAGTITTATNFTDTVDVAVVNGTTAGTVQLQAAANGVGTLTIQPGSSCSVTP